MTMNNSAPPLLQVENLQAHFRTADGINRAADGVSFAVAAGETLAVVGESGCGKSVTAMSLLRLIPDPPGRVAGAIRFEGKPLYEAIVLKAREMHLAGATVLRGPMSFGAWSSSGVRRPLVSPSPRSASS